MAKDGPQYAYLVALGTEAMIAVDNDQVPDRRIRRLGPGKGFSLKPQVKESVALAGARVTVDSAGQLEKRVTATRLILTGPLAFGLRKKRDSRELFLMVEGDDGGFVVEVNPKYQRQAREAATKINALARAADPRGAVDELRKLSEMRAEGILTESEFQAAKAQLLERL